MTGGGFGCIGDLMAQLLFEKNQYNLKRTEVVSAYGFAETIIEGHFWLNFLDKVFGTHRTMKNALLKTGVDMVTFYPLEIAFFII